MPFIDHNRTQIGKCIFGFAIRQKKGKTFRGGYQAARIFFLCFAFTGRVVSPVLDWMVQGRSIPLLNSSRVRVVSFTSALSGVSQRTRKAGARLGRFSFLLFVDPLNQCRCPYGISLPGSCRGMNQATFPILISFPGALFER